MQSFKINSNARAGPVFHQSRFFSDSPQEILAKMSLRQKIAQLIIAAAVSNEEMNRSFMTQSPYRMEKNHLEFLIKHCEIGGVIFLGEGIQSEQAARDQIFSKNQQNPAPYCNGCRVGPGNAS